MSSNFTGNVFQKEGWFRSPDTGGSGVGGGGDGGKDGDPSGAAGQIRKNLIDIKALIVDVDFDAATALIKNCEELLKLWEPTPEEENKFRFLNRECAKAAMELFYPWNEGESEASRPEDGPQQEQFSLIEAFRKKTLINLFREWQTESITKTEEIRFVLFQAIEEKCDSMKGDFIQLAEQNGETNVDGEKRFKDFSELLSATFDLIDFGVLSSRSLNTNNLTAKHQELLNSLTIDGAMDRNKDFNNNALVNNSDDLDREQFSSKMGVVQKMTYAAYQEMKKTPEQQKKYSRNKSFSSDTTKDLFENYLPTLTSLSIIDNNTCSLQRSEPFPIETELVKFPKEAKELICFIAKLKTTRDDLGSKAGLWHLGRHKGAFKYSDGEKGRPTGLLSAILYNVGKNTAKEMHAATLAWLDPRNIEIMAQGRTNGALQQKITRQKPLYLRWNTAVGGDAVQNQQTVFMIEELNNFLLWRNKNWDDLNFKKYVPKSWDDDFPSIDILTNQFEDITLADDYLKSKNAVLTIIQYANSAFASLTLSTDTNEMIEKIQVLVKGISSEIAKAGSFIGKYERGNKYFYTHQLIDAAVRFYFWGILNAVPGEDTLLAGKTGVREFGKSLRYDQLYQVAVNTMIEQVEINTSLKTGYQDSFIDFIKNPNIKRPYVYAPNANNAFNTWRVDNKPELKKLKLIEQVRELDKQPKCPVNVSAGWKSAYEEPAIQKSV